MSVRHRRSTRLAVALIAGAVVVAACGGSNGEPSAEHGSSSTTTEPGAAPRDTTDPTEPEGTPEPGPGATAGPGGAPAPTAAPPDSAPSPTTTAAAVPAPGGVGDYAAFYLRPSESASVVLDVHSQSGAEPSGDSIGHVRRVLADVTGKQVALNGGTIAGAGRAWTAADIRSLADRTGLGQSRDRSVLKLFFLRGEFADSDTVLGVAVRSDVAAIFSDKVDSAAGPLDSTTRIETAVTTHEVGHLLGLVDLVLATGREDPEHPGHSSNRQSVMYWAVESTLVGSLLDGGPPTTFDSADRADLATIRNG